MRRAGVALLAALVCAPRALHATTAAQICLGDPCVLARTVELGPGSVLDFGDRAFRMTGSSRLRIQPGDTLTIRARKVDLQPGALIDQLSPANSRPASVTIATSAGIQLQRGPITKSRINLSAPLGGGTITFDAGGNVDVDGDLVARLLSGTANGGNLRIEAGGDVNLRGDIQLEGPAGGIGGDLEVDAAGSVLLSGRTVSVTGGLQGGTIDILAGRTLTTLTMLDASGSAASDGGELNLVAAGDVMIGASIAVQGSGTELAGGSGGDVTIAAGGNLTLGGNVQAWGRGPEALGGTIDLDAGIDLLQDRQILADGRGLTGFGGSVELHAGQLLRLGALITVQGNEFAGELTGEAGAEIQARAEIDAGGNEAGSISLSTLATFEGQLYVTGPISVSGNLHAAGRTGGSVELQGCSVSITSSATVSTSGTEVPGLNRLQSSGQTTIAGALLSQVDGVNDVQYLNVAPEFLPTRRVIPAARLTQLSTLPECRPPTPAVCGNGVRETGEACDDQNTTACDGCSAQCRAEECGNGVPECLDSPTRPEVCDDGNRADADGCDSNCTVTACGNGIRTAPEACDDGNRTPGDGCDRTCAIEPPPGCGDGNTNQDLGEECDDGNTRAGDGCSPLCRLERCGNNVVDPREQCDDGNTDACDSCSATCQLEACGNRMKECGEECDDGNAVDGDGCDSNCTPSRCGNGIVTAGEQCDDANTTDCDGCSPTCRLICGNGRVDSQCGEPCDPSANNGQPDSPCSPTCGTCLTGTPECPCAADRECGPGGRCGGFACDRGLCAEVAVPQCDDGEMCNGTETCVEGSCQSGTPPSCDDGNVCNGTETCTAGACVSPGTFDCEDGDDCTDDSCSAPDGCVHGVRPGVPGIDCQIRAMTGALDRSGASDATPALRRKLQKLLKALGQKAAQAAAAAGNAKRERKLAVALRKQLAKLDRLVTVARGKHQIAPALDGQLTAARQGAGRALETLLNAPRR